MATTVSDTPSLNFQEFVLSRREKVFTLIGTLLGLLLAALDQTIVATAGPAIQRDLRVSPSVYPWITTAYLVASTVMVPIYGKLSDVYGRKPILLSAIVIFLLGSFACGISITPGTLIAARALQGLGSAGLFTSAFAVAADIFAPAERGRYQGIFGACFALSSVVGPLIGGFLTDRLSWHWVFFVNLPLGMVAIAFIVMRMPLLRRPRKEMPRIDYAGAFWLLASVVPFLLALSTGRQTWSQPSQRWWIVLLLALSTCALVGFVARERRAPEPLLDFALFKNRVFAVGTAASFIFGAAFLGAIVFLPLFMVNVVGLSATDAGFTLTPLTFGIVAGNVLSGQLVSRMGRYKPLMLVGNAVLLLGFVLLGFTLSAHSTQREVTLKMVALGLGLGPTIPLYTLAIQNAVSPKDLGVATSAATFFRQIGSTMGVSLFGVVFAMTLASGLSRITVPASLSNLAPLAVSATPSNGEPVQLRFDAKSHRSAVESRYHDDPVTKAEALVGLSHLELETKRAFTRAIEAIYRLGLLAAILGSLATLLLPELPLRQARSAAGPTPAPQPPTAP